MANDLAAVMVRETSVDPARIDDGAGWGAMVSDYIDFVRAARPADPAQPVMVPGDPERKARAERRANGVPLPVDTWDSLVAAARSVGLGEDAIPELTGRN